MKKSQSFLLIALVSVVVLVLVLPYALIGIKANINRDIVDNLEGRIFYTKRVDSVLTLFMSDSNLQNETLLYSHQGKGKINSEASNDNIIDFYYDEDKNRINFLAMDEDWTVFSFDLGEKEPSKIGKEDVLADELNPIQSKYLAREQDGINAFTKGGSLYISDGYKEECVKRFYGIYDDKFTGYGVISFSPDGKYLVYSSAEFITPIAFFVNHLITGFNRNIYIMELETGKSARFVDAYDIQWLMD